MRKEMDYYMKMGHEELAQIVQWYYAYHVKKYELTKI
jgi:hypothetical protein